MKRIYAIEISNKCNLTCNYCPHKIQKRQKGFMNLEDFKQTLTLVKELKQDKLTLHNFGEPLLHPQLEEFIKLSKEVVPNVNLSTNGVLLTRDKAIKLKEAGLDELYFSEHNKALTKKVIDACEGLNLLKSVRSNFWHDWAGTAPLKKDEIIVKVNPCVFLKYNWVAVLWDGRVSSCCMDVEGIGVIGHINEENILTKNSKVFNLCKNCHSYKALQEKGK